MYSLDEIMNMSKEDFVKGWDDGSIVDSSLKLLGAREMTEEDKKHIENE